MKEIITWALSVWPILAAIGSLAVLMSGWVIKHDLTSKKAQAQGTVGRPKMQIQQDEATPVSLTETLTAMHRRLIELQKEKASHTRVSFRQFEAYIPTLAGKMGTIRLNNWHKFNKSIKRRIQRAAGARPTFPYRFRYSEWVRRRAEYAERVRLAGLSIASQVKDELLGTKEWALEDCVKASEWLDGYDWGLKKLRDNDSQWESLRQSIAGYLNNNDLRPLIEKHINLSYVYNNVSLTVTYTERFRKDSFSWMLHEVLVGSPYSPEKAETALSEVLNEIEQRLAGEKSSLVMEELDTTTILLNDVNVSIARIFWGFSDFLTGAWAEGGLRPDVLPQLLASRFQEHDPAVWTSAQQKLISTLRMKKLINVEQRPVRFGMATYYVATDLGLEVLDKLKSRRWPEPKIG